MSRSWTGQEPLLSISLLAALCLWTMEVAAEPLNLVWQAPAGCPEQAAVVQGIERIVGRPLSEISVPWTSAQAVVVPDSKGWLLQVVVVNADDTRHERSLTAASCAEAGEAASVVLATSLGAAEAPVGVAGSAAPNSSPEPAHAVGTPAAAGSTEPVTAHDAAAAAQTPAAATNAAPLAPTPPVAATVVVPAPPQPAPPQPAPPVAPADAKPPAAPEVEATSAWAGSLGARAGVDTSTLGQPAAAVGLIGGVEFEPLALRAFANATDSVDHEVPETQAGASIAIYAGGLQGCAALAGAELRLEGCAGGQVGALRAKGYGFPDARTESLFWSAGQGSLLLRWRRRGWGSFWAEAELIVPFRELYVALEGTLHETPPASGQIWLGFDVGL